MRKISRGARRQTSSVRHVLVALSGPPLACCCLLLLTVLLTGCKNGASEGFPLSLKDPFGRSEASFENAGSRPSGYPAGRQPGKPTPAFAREMAKARHLESAGKYDEARSIYEKMLVTNPGRYEPYHRLGVVADKQRKFREAEALYAQAIRRNPTDPELFNDLGYCLFLQGRLEKSERALLKAVGLSPSNRRYRNNLGLVYGYQGRYGEALEQLGHAGSEADAYYNLAFVFTTQRDVEQAKHCFRLALAADPTYERARRALKSFERFEEDPHGLLDEGPIVENGIRWVPYVEGQQAEAEGPQTVSHEDPTAPGRLVPSTRPSTQARLRRARSVMSDQILGR